MWSMGERNRHPTMKLLRYFQSVLPQTTVWLEKPLCWHAYGPWASGRHPTFEALAVLREQQSIENDDKRNTVYHHCIHLSLRPEKAPFTTAWYMNELTTKSILLRSASYLDLHAMQIFCFCFSYSFYYFFFLYFFFFCSVLGCCGQDISRPVNPSIFKLRMIVKDHKWSARTLAILVMMPINKHG